MAVALIPQRVPAQTSRMGLLAEGVKLLLQPWMDFPCKRTGRVWDTTRDVTRHIALLSPSCQPCLHHSEDRTMHCHYQRRAH